MKKKLVRDKIPLIIEKSGRKPIYRVLSDSEYNEKLLDKLDEECHEFICNPSVEELADILEVIDCLKSVYKISEDELEKFKNLKKLQNGSFAEKIFLEDIKIK